MHYIAILGQKCYVCTEKGSPLPLSPQYRQGFGGTCVQFSSPFPESLATYFMNRVSCKHNDKAISTVSEIVTRGYWCLLYEFICCYVLKVL